MSNKKSLKYKRKQSIVKETKRQFLLTFFDKENKEKYIEKEVNGFLLIKYFDTYRQLFVVRVYNSGESDLFKGWLNEYLKGL